MPADYPTVRPLQMLDFKNQAKLDSRFNFFCSTSRSYIDASGIMRIAEADQMRPAYNPSTGEYLGLLMESPSTNLLPWSNDITASGWYYAPQNGPVSSGYIGIGATSSAYRIAEGTVPGSWYVATTVAISASKNIAASVFVKSDGVNRGYLQVYGVDGSGLVKGNVIAYFDLQRNTVFPENYGVNTLAASIERMKNGWYRVGCMGPMASGATLGVLNLALQDDSGSLFYQGQGRGLLTDGFQVEQGATNAYVSSFIATSGAAATRSLEYLESKSSEFDNWYTQSGLTFYCESIVDNNDFFGLGRFIMQAINTNTLARAELRVLADPTLGSFVGASLASGVANDFSPSPLIGIGNGLQGWENPTSGNGTSKPQVVKTAFSFSSSGLALAYNNNQLVKNWFYSPTQQVITGSGLVPSGINRMTFQSAGAGKVILRRAAIYPLLNDSSTLLITA